MLATIVIQPHIKKKLTPGKLLPFTWDKKRTAAKDEALSYNERMERAEKARRKFENL